MTTGARVSSKITARRDLGKTLKLSRPEVEVCLSSGKGMVMSSHLRQEKHRESGPGILLLKNGVNLSWVQSKKD